MTMFKRKKPCENCPFRIGQGSLFQLNPERLHEIKHSNWFQCHKTVKYDEGGEPIRAKPGKAVHCAGLITVLHRDGRLNFLGQIAERTGQLNCDELDPDNEAYRTWSDVLEAHAGREPGQTQPT